MHATFRAMAVAFLLGSLCASAHAANERGYPVINMFRIEDYKAGTQNFNVIQDSSGILYFGNLAGLLAYDGAWWTLVELPNKSAEFGLAADDRGHVALGAIGDFGVLDADSHGNLVFRSLLPELPPAMRDVGEVRSVSAHGNGFLFASDRLLIEWNGKSAKVLADYRSAPAARRCFNISGKTYVAGPEGLQQLGGPLLFAGKVIETVVPNGVVAVRGEGLFTIDGAPFAPDASRWLATKSVTSGARLRDGRMAFTTRENGLLIVDGDGRLEQHIDTQAGLPDSMITGCAVDRDGALWLALYSAIARIDLSSPQTQIDARNGLNGLASDLVRHRGKLFIAAAHGVYTVEQASPEAGGIAYAKRVEGVPSNVWSVVSTGDEVLAGTLGGIYKVEPGPVSFVEGSEKLSAYQMLHSAYDRNRIWVATRTGLAALRKRDGVWRFDHYVKGSRPYARGLLEEGGVLWCGTVFDGVMRVGADESIEVFGTGEVKPYLAGGRLIMVRSGEILHTAPGGRLVPDPILGRVTAPSAFYRIAEDGRGNIWLNSVPPAVLHRHTDGSYDLAAQPFVSIRLGDISMIHADDDGVMWFGSDNGILRQAPAPMTPATVPTPRIRRVVAGKDRLLFGGFGASRQSAELPYEFSRLRIEVAPTSYRPPVAYQFRLDPVDSEWSAWTSEPFIDYTNLAENDYSLHIRIREAGGSVSPEVRWSFVVLPPWYRTTWAYALWTLLAIAALVLVVRLRTRALRRQAELLHARVDLQTLALSESVEQLRHANELLESLSIHDDLTGIANRRYFQRSLTEEWERGRRRREPLALVILDLDNFKELNDTLGHQAGDECLRRIGQLLGEMIRGGGDVVARYGGEEFAVLLPGIDAMKAAAVAERLREGIAALRISRDGRDDHIVTASCGVWSLVPESGLSPDILIEHADRALYVAKHDGRNCVRIAA